MYVCCADVCYVLSFAAQVVTDKNSYESASGQSSESRKLQAGDVSYAETSKKAATKEKLEVDGYTAEKAAAVSQVSTKKYIHQILFFMCGRGA